MWYNPFDKELVVLYALRKLIAFVFLGGIFWFIYSDPANIGKPAFMNAVGVLVAVFGAFWLFVPSLVVLLRIRRRIAHNREGYSEWLAAHGDSVPEPLPPKACRIDVEDGERVYMHEKGTFYARPETGFDSISVRGAPGDVAFPRLRGNNREIQRTHFYITGRRVFFAGKSISFSVPFADIRGVSAAPGGLVFRIARDGRNDVFAFTFQNPLIADEIVRRVMRLSGAERK